MYYCYILFSSKTGRFYIGSAADLETRLNHHNAGYDKSTRPGRPWELVWSNQYQTRSEACRKERLIKSWKSAVKIRELIGMPGAENGPFFKQPHE
ncbi:MAG: GIY-YIG nuclease family protein [Bacteroidetes bacterium]|nr:GIY-YIG nuclease family protein [Bacteroidota bacterium]